MISGAHANRKPTAAWVPSLVRVLAVAGLLASMITVWFVGPLVAIAGHVPLASEPARAAVIGALLVGALARAGWRSARSARRNRALMEGLARPAPGEQEVALLGQRFAQALQLLRRSRVGGRHPWLAALAGRPFVYQLPWYVIIGAPGAGKTTALVNSGLEFPLAEKVGDKVVRGIGGTRHCDWWFTSEAVLVDTAGRYTTHDSDQAADRTAWLGFLDLLRRYRPRRPLNGVLLTVSASDLLSTDADARLAHAATLRARLEELHERLAVRLPIYVLITKTDLLAGFMEFFADLDKDQRAQVWGVTFAHDETSSGDSMPRLAGELAALERRLNDRMIERLRIEPDRERRAAIYAFPQQWQLLRQTLGPFLEATFATVANAPPPWVRGVYFTSATQEGTPMDRALGALARSLGLAARVLAPARPSGKTFFVTRLLGDVVFAEAGLAGTHLRRERQRAWLERGLAAASVVAVLAVGLLAGRAFVDQRSAIAAMGERLPALQRDVAVAKAATPSDLPALLPVLDALHTLAQDAASAPAVHPMGLDRREMLGTAAADAYRRALKEAFLPRIAARLEQRIRHAGDDHVELIYESLRAYLMLFGGKHFERAALRAYLAADWQATLPATVSAAQHAALRTHLERLLAGAEVGAPSQADPALVTRARSVVAGVPLVERVYRRLQQLDLGAGLTDFSVSSAAGEDAARVFVRASGRSLDEGVPALYSRAVFQAQLRERAAEVLRQFEAERGWVLGAAAPSEASATLLEDVERLYLADYARLWREFITDLRLVSPTSLTQASTLAQRLGRPDSPLTALLRAVVREVSVGGPSGEANAGTDEPALDPAFAALRRYVTGRPAGVDGDVPLLAALSAQLMAVEDAVRHKRLPPAGDAPHALADAARRAPEPVRQMLTQLASTSTALVFAASREPLARGLAGEVAPACTQAVAGRYPLVRSSREEIPREAFVQTFAANGLLDGFFQRHLAPHVDLSARTWVFRGAGRDPGGESLAQFQRAREIREQFFVDGGRRLEVHIELRLLALDPAINDFVIDIDGQAWNFRRDSRQVQVLRWPGAGGAGRIQLQVTSAAGAGAPYTFEGPWALLRLLDRVRIEPGSQPDRFVLAFDIEGRTARFDARSDTPLTPQRRAALEQFQCPKRL